MDTLETLKAALALIEDERDWYRAPLTDITGVRSARGRKKRCMGAALCHVGCPYHPNDKVWAAVRAETGNEEIYEFNFAHPHAEILGAFDAAIAKLEAKSE